MKRIALPTGELVPALGLGTWRMGEGTGAHKGEVAALRAAFDIGYRAIDTAEMYGEGGAEKVVGEALQGALAAREFGRGDMFVVSKVYPHNASRSGTPRACERSLKRLGIEAIDLYLLHWRGTHPLAETVEAFEGLKARGLIRHWGVSNFDVDDMDELWRVAGGDRCAANQVYYSASERGIEHSLLPWLRERAVPVMAYSPIERGKLAQDATIRRIAARLGASPIQVALAWVMRHPDVMAIPKSANVERLRENFAAAGIELGDADRAELDRGLPPPKRKRPLAMT